MVEETPVKHPRTFEFIINDSDGEEVVCTAPRFSMTSLKNISKLLIDYESGEIMASEFIEGAGIQVPSFDEIPMEFEVALVIGYTDPFTRASGAAMWTMTKGKDLTKTSSSPDTTSD